MSKRSTENDRSSRLSRRGFLTGATGAAAGAVLSDIAAGPSALALFDSPLLLSADGPMLSPAAFASLLRNSTAESSEADTYGAGGITAELERHMAETLGKEAALFVPTGTLANQIAIRVLSGPKSHIVVQDSSHVFRDEYGIAETMSGKKPINLSPNEATFSVEALEEVVFRHPSDIGAISIETPVRRLHGERFRFGGLEQVTAFARDRGIRMHLDGARIFIESSYTGIPVRSYAACFDTVYVCLYKCFGAGSGAILCGSKEAIERASELRNLFGARLFKTWPYAAVALHLARGFEERFDRARMKAERLFKRMNASGLFRVEPIPNGTNVFRLHVEGESPETFRHKMSGDDLRWSSYGFTETYGLLRVNETWNSMDDDELFARMRRGVARKARIR